MVKRAFAWLGCLLLCAASLRAETAQLELRVLSESREYRSKDYYLGMTSAQHFHMQGDASVKDGSTPFDPVVEKEPKYSCDQPMKRVALIGSYKYGLVLDSTDLKSHGYDRLYVDFNRNGDLTDDEPLKAGPGPRFGGSYHRSEFPRMTLEVEADGVTFECPFRLSAGMNISENGVIDYAWVSLQNAAYREGKITLDDKTHEIVLLDYNSDGSFNGLFRVNESIKMHNDTLYPESGDMVLIDPDHKAPRYSGYHPSDSPDRQYLSNLVNIEGRYYRISVTPSGHQVTIEKADLPMGAVSNSNGPYRAVLFGEQGMIKIAGDKDKPVAVPAGEWRLLEYQINLTDAPAASQPKSTPKPRRSLGQRLAGILGISGDSGGGGSTEPKMTLVGARATSKGKSVNVAEGKTEVLPFGPPYKPKAVLGWVNAHDKQANLNLQIIGSAGEVCESLVVKGNNPPRPSFTIRDKSGELVKKGQFEYG